MMRSLNTSKMPPAAKPKSKPPSKPSASSPAKLTTHKANGTSPTSAPLLKCKRELFQHKSSTPAIVEPLE
ncbi:hypothetical protein NC980_18090 [Leptolyngbya sp. AS-A5]